MSCTVITGGGRGIGLALAETLLAADPRARCALVDLELSEAEALRDRVGDDRVLPIASDVTDRAAADRAATQIAAWAGADGVTGLVTAAGVARAHDSVDIAPEAWHGVLDVHLDGTLFWAQAVAPLIRDAGGGAIVCLSSVVTQFGHPRRLAYASGKAAVEAMVRTLAVEWGDWGIRVNGVAPGYVGTDMIKAMEKTGAIDLGVIAQAHVVKRVAEPSEIADPIAYLLSDKASFITGAVLVADGGYGVVKTVTAAAPAQ